MNTGIQDAANLGWKLAAAVHGWGDERLLDSYYAERYPVGRQVLRSSGALVRLALISPRWGREARNMIGQVLMSSGRSRTGWQARSPASASATPRRMEPIPGWAPPAQPPAGRWKLYEALRGGRFVLLGTDAGQLDLPPQVDAAVPARPTGELMLARPDGYLAWVGTVEQFPAWASEYFRQNSYRGGSETSPVRRR